MPLLKLALIVTARRELILSAGEVKRNTNPEDVFTLSSEPVQVLDGPTYLKVGVAQTGSIYVTGAEIINIDYPADSLTLSWYLPGEENADSARPVDLSKVGLIPSVLPRDDTDPENIWYFKVDERGPFTETLFFDSGFQPPFKHSDITLYLTDLGNFGYKTMVLTKVLYGYRAPSYTEGDWTIPKTIAQGFLQS
ncbi:MAG: hypothetical protein LBF22_01930 [Deltaproteobacteria bacterium]|jgi:hypothetical protein|nr:hypothetical protein [Deltaproteobacteria bacterium]